MKARGIDTLKEALLKDLSTDYFDGALAFKRTDSFTLETSGERIAINKFENPPEKVSVIPWFGNFAVYMKICASFAETNNIGYFVSICFFVKQAENYDQLFRAEWDNYRDDSSRHPQPHWHITSNLAVEKNLEDLEKGDGDLGEYAKLFKEEKDTSLNIFKIHFAMAGSWFDKGNYKNKITAENQMITWMKRLFEHVRYELEYISN